MKIDLYGSGMLTPSEEVLSRRMLATLHKHYPGFEWMIEINGAMANIKNMSLVGQYGYRINTLQHPDWALDKEVMRGGGECLERYEQAWGRKNDDTLMDVPRDRKGLMVPSL